METKLQRMIDSAVDYYRSELAEFGPDIVDESSLSKMLVDVARDFRVPCATDGFANFEAGVRAILFPQPERGCTESRLNMMSRGL